jgi:hypothetical protein
MGASNSIAVEGRVAAPSGEISFGEMTESAFSEFPVERFVARRQRRADNSAGVAARRRATRDFAQYRTRIWAKVTPVVFAAVVVAVLWISWLNREDSGLTPESGTGYWLGIAGSSLMLLLLLYPLRKRMRSLRLLGTVTFWFRAHMILGIMGPVLILLHANFRLGSVNSNVALAAMLVVAMSGIVGRYLYGKIHLGLYGRKAAVREMLTDADALKELIAAGLPVADRVVAQLEAFDRLGTTAPRGVLAGLLLLPVVGWRARLVRRRLIADARRVIEVEGKRLGWPRKMRRRQLAGVADLVTLHVAAVRKAAALAVYERLFSFWHIFHLPLFFLLVVAAIIHIFAAHLF